MHPKLVAMITTLFLLLATLTVQAEPHVVLKNLKNRPLLAVNGSPSSRPVHQPLAHGDLSTDAFANLKPTVVTQTIAVQAGQPKGQPLTSVHTTLSQSNDASQANNGAHRAAQTAAIQYTFLYAYNQPMDNLTNAQQPPKSLPAVALATCTVTKKEDSGAGTLRACLTNAAQGTLINFDSAVFPPNAPATILLSAALPFITVDQVTIDGSNAGVILNGQALAAGSGLVIAGAAGVTVRGVQIINFPWDGLALIQGATNAMIGGDRAQGTAPLGQGNLLSGNANANLLIADTGTNHNQVLGNYIGVNVTGTQAANNGGHGIAIGRGATNTVIGGTTATVGNLISGNHFVGILIRDAGVSGNQVVGNYIGVNKTGSAALPNLDGIVNSFGAHDTTIGGETAGAGNLISGNQRSGVYLLGVGADNNRIIGNRIGTDAAGATALGNIWGIVITTGAQNNLVGGTNAQARNLISGNNFGVQMQDAGTSNNRVLGNSIGVDVTGTKALKNTIGVVIRNGAPNNVIGSAEAGGGNLISGNEAGIQLEQAGTINNQIMGNMIGLNVSGTTALPNVVGISIGAGASNNSVGGETTGARNLISGNLEAGVRLMDANTTGNRVLGNSIGVDVTGAKRIGNLDGVLIMAGAAQNQVGGASAGARNLISGNVESGVAISGTATISNVIVGNDIGVTATSDAALRNNWGVVIFDGAQQNVIGGTGAGEWNLISGNRFGIQLQGGNGNRIVGNVIGLDKSGVMTVSNEVGIFIRSGASDNVIGGATEKERNLISGNETGITIQGIQSNATGNRVIGNYIGTNRAGTAALGNVFGIVIGPDAHNNIIGGSSAGEGNLISGNRDDGVRIQADANRPNSATGNQVIGNYIGVDVTGLAALGNVDGIVIGFGATNNLVGGTTTGARNLISGNREGGVWIQDGGSTGNQVMGNYIGVNATGTTPLGNKVGVIIAGAPGNIIGGAGASYRNLIGGHPEAGILIQGVDAANNWVQGNYIGVDRTGTNPVRNTLGIVLYEGAHDNCIGGSAVGAGNLVSGNQDGGIIFQDAGTVNNKVWGNFIGTNAAGRAGVANGYGVVLVNSAQKNLIGIAADQSGARNLISGNLTAGVTLQGSTTSTNTVTGNYIGTDVTGMAALGNRLGVSLLQGAHDNRIGGATQLERNLISGNSEAGIKMQNLATDHNRLLGNDIGVNAPVQARLPNGDGVFILDGAQANQIGALTPGHYNVISGNSQAGVHLKDEQTKLNRIEGNFIGTNITVTLLLSNTNGVLIEAGATENTIGISNTIVFNQADGVVISGTTTLRNTITRNRIDENNHQSIMLPDMLQPLPPRLTAYLSATHTLQGRACASCRIELFANPTLQAAGRLFLTDTMANATGNFTVTLPTAPPHPYLTATATAPDGTTSAFAPGLCTTVGCVVYKVYLPIICKQTSVVP